MAAALDRYFTDREAVTAMQRRAVETANGLTEEKVAQMLLDDVRDSL